MICCAQRRLFRLFQRLPKHYYTSEAIRFGTLCPDNLSPQADVQKNGTTLSVVHVKGVSAADPLPCLDQS